MVRELLAQRAAVHERGSAGRLSSVAAGSSVRRSRDVAARALRGLGRRHCDQLSLNAIALDLRSENMYLMKFKGEAMAMGTRLRQGTTVDDLTGGEPLRCGSESP